MRAETEKEVTGRTTLRVVVLRIAAIVGLSAVLGFGFNSANPVGLKWSGSPAASVPTNSAVAIAPPDGSQESSPSTAASNAPVAHSHPPLSPLNPAVVPMSPGDPSPIHWVDAKALLKSEGAVLVDVRPPHVFAAGHIPGAVSLPEISPPDVFAQFQSQFPKDKTLILYCSSTSCSMSERVAKRLVREFGYQSVKYMTGGYAEWQQAEAVNQPANQ